MALGPLSGPWGILVNGYATSTRNKASSLPYMASIYSSIRHVGAQGKCIINKKPCVTIYLVDRTIC